MAKQTSIKNWFINNLWNILTVAAMMVLSWAYLNGTVQTNAKDIEDLRSVVMTYPSQDFFELKFQTIDACLTDINKKIDTINNQ